VEDFSVVDQERRELRKLVEQIKSDSGCVLVLGPRIAVRAGDPNRRPLDEILAGELLASLDEATNENSSSLRHAADLHFRRNNDLMELQLSAQDFYAREAMSTTEFHRHLAQLPFRLCISASPDTLMLNAFENVGKHPQKDYYNFQPQGRGRKTTLVIPTVDQPLVYYLFGHHEDMFSLVLTELNLIDYLVAIIRGVPAVPDEVRSMLKDERASFLFLGFGFHNWYLRVLLKVLDVYGHRFRSIAFEDAEFVDAPESRNAIAFFKDKYIEFRRLRWEPFAEQLLQAYRESLPPTQAERISAPASLDASAPCAFLSYASEDTEAVQQLAEQLEASGIQVWQDKRNLRGGDRWNEVLHSVIQEKVQYVIVVQTKAMTTAAKGVFFWEIDAAQEAEKQMGQFAGQRLRFLVPVSIGHWRLRSLERVFNTIDISEARGLDLLVTSIKEDWENREELRARQERPA
jgi:hypothetical protein